MNMTAAAAPLHAVIPLLRKSNYTTPSLILEGGRLYPLRHKGSEYSARKTPATESQLFSHSCTQKKEWGGIQLSRAHAAVYFSSESKPAQSLKLPLSAGAERGGSMARKPYLEIPNTELIGTLPPLLLRRIKGLPSQVGINSTSPARGLHPFRPRFIGFRLYEVCWCAWVECECECMCLVKCILLLGDGKMVRWSSVSRVRRGRCERELRLLAARDLISRSRCAGIYNTKFNCNFFSSVDL